MQQTLQALIQWLRKRWYWLLAVLGVIGLGVYLNYLQTTVDFRKWLGFEDKTLWNLLELAIIPLVLAIGGYLFSQTERKVDREIAERNRIVDREIADQRDKTEREISDDRSEENLLQTYLDRMTELLLEKGLRESKEESEVRAVARARTLTVLRGLDSTRKGLLLRFLYEAKLIGPDTTVIELDGVDLRQADLREANLERVNLRGADLRWANLRWANLERANLEGAVLLAANLFRADLRWANLLGANLERANLEGAVLLAANLEGAVLREAKLSGAILRKANLYRADLQGAKVFEEQLSDAQSLEKATMPDGTAYE